MNKQNIQKQIEEKEKELEKLKKQLLEIENEVEWLEILEKGIKITTRHQFNGKTYDEILKEVKEDEIASYRLLQDLRNIGLKSEWKKYGFLKEFLVFVPNTDEVSKSNGYVSWFGASSDGALLLCDRDRSSTYSGLGVFLIKKIKE